MMTKMMSRMVPIDMKSSPNVYVVCCKEKLRLATPLAMSSVREKRQQNDDWDRYAKQPEKNASTHDVLLYIGRGMRTRSFHVPSRNEPPSTAARLGADAPNNMAAVNQEESFG